MNSESSPASHPSTCRACEAQLDRACRYCPRCGAYLNPLADVRDRHNRAHKTWLAVRGIIVFYVFFLLSGVPVLWILGNRPAGDALPSLLEYGL